MVQQVRLLSQSVTLKWLFSVCCFQMRRSTNQTKIFVNVGVKRKHKGMEET